ncbi:glycoside hydrolase family 16 protein [Lasallia pustulata]|uniref:Crh-like protein n=1 Tax=Lasallia pustulata TaxID=136370 RepID=A0A1W5CZ02_9LECA|nr:glycoside hydrolase family 16 protein [Lasallia pustulata]
MKTASLSSLLLTIALVSKKALAQTYSTCNPLTSGSCPADPALGKSINVDFTSSSTYFTPQGNPTYGANGVSFTIAKSGDSPQLISTFYIMFGHVEYVIQAAPGTGIVSSAVLQSDDLDEIDWEWLGADDGQVQSNYFGKGQTTTYNRGAFHPDPSNQNGFHTYTIDWTADQIVWSIDGTPVRTLTQASAEAGQYPQTPMQIKVGAWSGGDSSNQPGTIQWAGGPTNYGAGPYSMIMKSIAVTDYSTGTQYTYSGTSGSWQSIQAVGGTVNSGGNGASPAGSAAPAVTSTSNGAPMPFEGTHSDSSSTFSPPSIYPWVAGATTLQTSTVAEPTTYAGLPSGWTVTSSGKVIPPSGAASVIDIPYRVVYLVTSCLAAGFVLGFSGGS